MRERERDIEDETLLCSWLSSVPDCTLINGGEQGFPREMEGRFNNSLEKDGLAFIYIYIDDEQERKLVTLRCI